MVSIRGDKHRIWKGFLDNPKITYEIDEKILGVLEIAKTNAENLTVYIEGIKNHTWAIQELGEGIKEFRELPSLPK